MKWLRYVAFIRRQGIYNLSWSDSVKKWDRFWDVDRKMILMDGLDSAGSGLSPMADQYKHGI
jgi:hypothetical protein